MPIIDDQGRTSIGTIRSTIANGSTNLGSYYKTPNGPTPTSYTLVPTSGRIAYSMFRNGFVPPEEPETKIENIDAYTYRKSLKTGIADTDPLSKYIPSYVTTIIFRTASTGTDFPRENADPNNFVYATFDVAGQTIYDFRWFIYLGLGGRTGGRGNAALTPQGNIIISVNGQNPDGTRTTDYSGGPGAHGPGGNIMFLEDAKYPDGSKATKADIGVGFQYPDPIQWGPRGRPIFTDDCFDEMFGPFDPNAVNYIRPNGSFGFGIH